MGTRRFEADLLRREHDLSRLLLVIAELHLLPVRKSVLLLLLSSLFERSVANGTVIFLDRPYQLELSAGVEIYSTLSEQVLQMGGHISSCEVHSFAGVSKRISFVNRNDMSDSVSRIQDNTS